MDNPGHLKSVQAIWNPGLVAQPGYQAIFLKSYTELPIEPPSNVSLL